MSATDTETTDRDDRTTRRSKLQRYTSTKSGFLLADRQVKTIPAAVSLAASWIWVQALFVSTGQAHLNGYVGLAYFTVANVLALIIFAPFLKRLVEKMPEGYTVSGYYRERFSPRVQKATLFQYATHSIGGFAVNVLVGAGLISLITGWNYVVVNAVLALGAFAYTAWAGMKASIVTDWIMYGLIALSTAVVVPLSVVWAVDVAGSGGLNLNGLNDVTWTNEAGLMLLLTFGIPVSLVLLSGPLTEQMYWARGLASARAGNPFKVALYAAAFFGAIPLALGFLGFAGATAGVEVEGGIQEAGFSTLSAMVAEQPLFGALLLPYALIALSGIMSTADSTLNSLGTLVGHDGTRRGMGSDAEAVRRARIAMAVMTVAVIGIVNVPTMDILWLWFFYGAIRISTMVPTMFALGRPDWKVTEPAMFWAMIAGFLVAVPLLTYDFVASAAGSPKPWAAAGGVVGAFVLSSLVLVVVSKRTRISAPVPQL